VPFVDNPDKQHRRRGTPCWRDYYSMLCGSLILTALFIAMEKDAKLHCSE
jgi:hypothetical protein